MLKYFTRNLDLRALRDHKKVQENNSPYASPRSKTLPQVQLLTPVVAELTNKDDEIITTPPDSGVDMKVEVADEEQEAFLDLNDKNFLIATINESLPCELQINEENKNYPEESALDSGVYKQRNDFIDV